MNPSPIKLKQLIDVLPTLIYKVKEYQRNFSLQNSFTGNTGKRNLIELCFTLSCIYKLVPSDNDVTQEIKLSLVDKDTIVNSHDSLMQVILNYFCIVNTVSFKTNINALRNGDTRTSLFDVVGELVVALLSKNNTSLHDVLLMGLLMDYINISIIDISNMYEYEPLIASCDRVFNKSQLTKCSVVADRIMCVDDNKLKVRKWFINELRSIDKEIDNTSSEEWASITLNKLKLLTYVGCIVYMRRGCINQELDLIYPGIMPDMFYRI